MVERRWPACISDSNGRPRIRVYKGKRRVFDETLDANIYSKSGLAAAIKRRDEVKHRIALGLPINDEESEYHFFEDAAQEYMNQLTAQLSTHLGYESIINNWWMPEFAGLIAEEITLKDVKRVMGRRDVSRKTKLNALIPLRGIFDLLDIRPNPADYKPPKKGSQKAPVERYRPDEREALLSQLGGEELLYFSLLMGCGFRPGGEVLALMWSDYDGEQFHVHQTITRRKLKPSTKTEVRRKVVVPEWVRPLLLNHPTRFEGGFVFLNSQGNHYCDSDKFNLAWRKAHDRAGIRYRIPYTCRHTRAAELLSTGVEPVDAANQLGHSLQMFSNIYSEFMDEYYHRKDNARFNGVAPQLPNSSRTNDVVPI